MILLIDNYDSFSYNLYQLIGGINPDIRVIRNDELTLEEIKALKPSRTGVPKRRRHLHCRREGTGPNHSHIGRVPRPSGNL